MLPSGATAGPSVRPPEIGALRVKRSSSFASGSTMAAPVGRGVSATAEDATSPHSAATARKRIVTSFARLLSHGRLVRVYQPQRGFRVEFRLLAGRSEFRHDP